MPQALIEIERQRWREECSIDPPPHIGGSGMKSFELNVNVPEDRRLTIVLPEWVPIGKVRLKVSILWEFDAETLEPRRSSLADWAEENAEPLGETIRSDDVEGFTARRF